jgi:EpsI family protein
MRIRWASVRRIAVAIAAIVALWPTWPSLVSVWSESQDYAHGFLIAALALVWLMRRAVETPVYPRQSFLVVWPFLLLSMLLWLVAYRAHSAIGQQLTAPVVIWAALVAVEGPLAAVRLLPPIAFLYCAIPVWSLLVPILQELATVVVEGVLNALQIPVRIEGTFIHLGAGSFQIAEGCSGVRYLIVAMATGALLASSYRATAIRGMTYLGLTAILAVVANWLRIMIIIIAGHLTDMQHYLVSEEHTTFGWAVFALILVAVVLVGRQMLLSDERPAAASLVAQPGPMRGAGIKLATTLSCLSLLPLAVAIGVSSESSPVSGDMMPQASGHWQGPFASTSSWAPRFVGASASARGKYISGLREIDLYAAEYQTQRSGSELLHYGNSVSNHDWVTIEARWSRDATGESHKMRRTQLEAPDGTRWVVLHAFQVGPLVNGSEMLTQIAYGFLSLRREVPTRVLAVAYRCADQCADADAVIYDFLAAVKPWPVAR